MSKSHPVAAVSQECVACGCCVTVCPKGAVSIDSGVIARIDALLCIGCGRCVKVCPAAVMSLAERRSVG